MTKITLTAGGPRTRVQHAEAKQILARFQKTLRQHGGDDCCVHTLNLSCRQWPLESLQVLAPVLQQICSQVVILKVDDIIAGLETDDGLATLGFLATIFSTPSTDASDKSCIKEIDLSDNALGTRGAVVLKPLLQLASLQRLYFSNCGLSAESFSETLLPILQMNALHWTALGLGRNQLGPTGAEQVGSLLEDCVNLESFAYAGTRPLVEGTGHICKGLAAMTVAGGSSLQMLDLDDCTFRSGDDDTDPCLALCQCLQASPALRKLVLRDGELQVAGLQRVLKAVQQAGARLQILDLGAVGEMAEEGAAVLLAYLETTGAARYLQELSFDTNELTDAGVADLVAPFTAHECCLRKLNLAENELEAAGIRVLLDNPIKTLKELNLADNPDIPLQLAVLLQAMYPDAVKVEADLEEGDLDEGEEEEDDEDDDVDGIATQLAGSHL
jgi:Ran GTPase-activating protein (RanGAP) involved in mRNA processing and transport